MSKPTPPDPKTPESPLNVEATSTPPSDGPLTERARPQKPKSLLRDRNLIYLCLVTTISIIGVAAITPLLPSLSRYYGVSDHLISLSIICFTLPGVICTPLSGILADRIGRKQVLVTSLFIFGVSGTACIFAPNFQVFLILRFLQGVGSAALGLLNMTIISDLYEDQLSRTKALAFLSGSLSISTAAVPVLAGILGEVSIDLVLGLPVLSILLGAIIWKTMPINSTPTTSESLREYLLNTFSTAAQKEILIVLMLSFGTFSLLFGAMNSFMPILADTRFSAAPRTIGLIFACASLGTLLGTLWITSNISRLVPRTLLLISFTVFGIVLAVLPLLPSLLLIPLPILFWGIGQGLSAPLLNAIMLNYAPPQNRGGLLAVQGTTIRFAQAAGPSLFSMIYAVFGMTAMFEIAAFFSLTLVALIYVMMPGKRLHG